jgi:hypothetical protein
MLLLDESPVMFVIEGTGFHPLFSRCAGMVFTEKRIIGISENNR